MSGVGGGGGGQRGASAIDVGMASPRAEHRCELCGVALLSAAQLDEHLAGRRHAAAVRDAGLSPSALQARAEDELVALVLGDSAESGCDTRATVRTFVAGRGKPPREPEPEPEPEPKPQPQPKPIPGQLMPAASKGGAADDLPGRVLL